MMRINIENNRSFLNYFASSAEAYVQGKTHLSLSRPLPGSDLIRQQDVFKEDLTYELRTFSSTLSVDLLSVALNVATLALAPFSLLIDIFRLGFKKPINFSAVLENFYVVPLRVIQAVFKATLCVASIVYNGVSTLSKTTGLLVWHGAEWTVKKVQALHTQEMNSQMEFTLLSKKHKIREIVYDALGITVLAAAAVFVPVLSIQLIALPIIMGSLYGTINNQFTVRNCPEYYTMGHYYDGTSLRGHAIETNNVLVKPIITGCYATAMVTKIAGVILAAAGAIPYATVALPIGLAAAMMGAVVTISLVAGHVFSVRAQKKLNQNVKEVAQLIDLDLTENLSNCTWKDLQPLLLAHLKRKVEQCGSNEVEAKKLKDRFFELVDFIDSRANAYDDVPLKYLPGWEANNIRNTCGYIGAGVGTLALTVMTVCLRIFVL